LSVGKGSISRVNNINTPKTNISNFPSAYSNNNLLDIDKITPVPEQWFFYDNSYLELKDLKNSIRKFGIIEPLIVRELENNNFQLLSGYKRLKAASEIGITQIKCEILRDISDEAAKEIFLELHKDKIPVADMHKAKFSVISKIKHDLPNYLL
jgi:ParB/RepB/Spo0J family partition protein